MRHYTDMRPRMKSRGLQHVLAGGATPVKPLSKLEDARLKLSKYKLKYSKQEGRLHDGSSLSSMDLPSDESSPKITSISKILVPPENSNLAGGPEVINNVSESTDSESFSSLRVPNTELNPINSIQEHFPKIGFFNEKLVQSRNESSKSGSSISEIPENIRSFSSLEIQSRTQDKDVSVKSVQDSSVANSPLPAVILEGSKSATSVSSVTDRLERGNKAAQTVQSQMAAVASLQETLNSVSSIQARERSFGDSTSSPNKLPDRVSSLLLVSLQKKPKQRHAKVQTDRKRSRTVQVSLSDCEPSYERRIEPDGPVLWASSLPRGLRHADEHDEYLAEDTKNAAQFLLNCQMKLTLNLLRREQALYVNCSRSAARLERGYQRHTLSDTRQFICQQKKLREELRRNAEKKNGVTAAV